MSSNFDFLLDDWPALHEDAVATEGNVFAAPRTSAFYARRTLEKNGQVDVCSRQLFGKCPIRTI